MTTLLNLDTSVTFLTPSSSTPAAAAVRARAPLLYACLLLSNAGSLLLPGSNLTNLIVLGHLHLSGRAFLDHMALPALAAAAVTALVVGVVYHRALRTTIVPTTEPERPVLGVGLVAIAVVTVLVVALRAPALPVAAVGWWLCCCARGERGGPQGPRPGRRAAGARRPGPGRALRPRRRTRHARAVLVGPGHPALPPRRLGHRSRRGVTSVLVNNLPAASLLAARQPPHPFALLIGLNVGPNLFVTGSLAWILWLRAAKAAGGVPTCGGPACWAWPACRSPSRQRSACWSSAAPAED